MTFVNTKKVVKNLIGTNSTYEIEIYRVVNELENFIIIFKNYLQLDKWINSK